jgi:hypothetical protein
MKYITLDEYYSVEAYNEAKEALKNNDIIPKEFISIKSPYSWYFQLEQSPIMVNYDEVQSSGERWLVNKVQALRSNDEYLLLRRNDSVGQKAVLKYTENEPLKEARTSDYDVFFNASSKELMEKATKDMPVRIWYFGKYYKNKYKVCMCTNEMIKNFISPSDILLEKNGSEYNEPGRFEAELNYKIFRGNDMLEKYTETPYFKDGKYNDVPVKGTREIAKRLKF